MPGVEQEGSYENKIYVQQRPLCAAAWREDEREGGRCRLETDALQDAVEMA